MADLEGDKGVATLSASISDLVRSVTCLLEEFARGCVSGSVGGGVLQDVSDRFGC